MKRIYHFLVTSYKLRVTSYTRLTPHTSYLIPLFAFCIFSAGAQNSFPNDEYHPLVQEGKVWSVLNAMWNFPIPPSPMGYYTYTTTQMAFFGDTIIGDITYNKLYTPIKKDPVFPQDWSLISFMREDENKKVWHKRMNKDEELLFDFSLEIGDTIVGIYMIPPLIVEDITYQTMLDGKERKIFSFSTGGSIFPDYWIEGIGSNDGLLIPFGSMITGGFYKLLCLHEYNELIFFNEEYQTCYKSSVGIDTYDNQINIYPNPAKNIIYIEDIDKLDVISISLINIYGQIIKQYDFNTTQLDISDIISGIYFVKISTSKENIVQKIIINQ